MVGTMAKMRNETVIRPATLIDADAMFLVLQACDSEIPVNLDDDDFKRYIRDKIRVACLGGRTRVAVSGNQVIGFLLALPLSSEEGWFELTYAGVLKNYRVAYSRKCFTRLKWLHFASTQL